MSDSLRPHGLQHARPPCASPTPGVYPKSCPLMCVGFFCNRREWGLLPAVVCGLLASLVAEHGALDPWASITVDRGFHSCASLF